MAGMIQKKVSYFSSIRFIIINVNLMWRRREKYWHAMQVSSTHHTTIITQLNVCIGQWLCMVVVVVAIGIKNSFLLFGAYEWI